MSIFETAGRRGCRTHPRKIPFTRAAIRARKMRRMQTGRFDMSLVVKICGLTTPETVDAAIEAGADMLGFVFFPPSPRHLGFEEAARLARHVGTRARRVALSVDADDRWLAQCIDAIRPDYLQLHGRESADRLCMIKTKFAVPVVKAIAVETTADVARAGAYRNVADWLLFDARAPKSATRPGGLGQPFDWTLLENLDHAPPFMLSGGLDAGNVGTALRITRADGVDVSSGVERALGEKDPDKIRAFIRAARTAEQAA
jgi:phosphoribosylanthranilate isomerase